MADEKWIPIFRTGAHIDNNGNIKIWRQDDLDDIVSKYNPSYKEAPIVIGHPKDNAPAYGWVEAIKRSGDFLLYKPKEVLSEFKDWVSKGLYKKRSISLRPDGSLRHIGYLGAVPPAVGGLPDIAFEEKEGISIDFSEEILNKFNDKEVNKTMTFKEFGEKLKNLFKEVDVDFDVSAEKSFSEAEVKSKVAAAVNSAIETEKIKLAAEFAEAQSKKENALLARENALKAKEAEAKKKESSDFCERLKKEGKIIPAMEKLGMGITNFSAAIAENQTTVDFAEAGADGTKKKQTPSEFFREFCKTYLPKQVEFAEFAGQDKDIPRTGTAGEKLIVMTNNRIKEVLKSGKSIDFAESYQQIKNENVTLVAEYANELKK